MTVDFSIIARSNKAALRDFVQGCSARSMVGRLRSKAARTEAYRAERHLTADEARRQAAKFVN
jgi:hypothetical protein